MKIFDIEKYAQWCKENDGEIPSFRHWHETCNGMTEEEMRELGYSTCEDWMSEKEANIFEQGGILPTIEDTIIIV